MENDEILNEFLVESREHLAGIESDLLCIEEAGANIDEARVNTVFRAAHSIKGGAAFFGLKRIQELGHKIETVLDMVRSREMVPTPETVNILLISFDKLREMINSPAQSNTADISEPLSALTDLLSACLPQEEKSALHRQVPIQAPHRQEPIMVAESDMNHVRKMGHYIYLVEYDLIHDVERRGRTPLDLIHSLNDIGSILDAAVVLEAIGTLEDTPSCAMPFQVLIATMIAPGFAEDLFDVSKDRISVKFDPNQASEKPAPSQAPPPMAANAVATVSMASAPVKSAAVPVPQKAAKAESPIPAEERDGLPPMGIPGTAASPDTLRVNVARLESLMNLAGELVLCRNQLLEAIAREDARSIGISGQRINLVTSELQDAIMQTRMQPVGSVFGKFTRLVRDMARNLDKEIQLRIEGRDVEIDKTLIEGLSDPLTHMVRNAVDHGLESREERRIAGKSPCGAITLKAGHEAGQVVIEVSDDGKGINPARIAAKAVEKGLVSIEQVKAMSDKDKTSLVFLPGLSTAEKVTDISGRGVGMDVVKTNLDRLGGKVEILSELGKGTLFRIKLPLTLAIIPSLIVSVGAERFAVPQINVVELLRIPAGEVRKRLEVVGGVEVLVLRGELIPVVRFADELCLEKIFIDPLTNEQKPDRREHIVDRRSPRHPTHRCESGLAADAQARRQGPSETDRRDAPDRRYRASSSLNIIVLTTGMMRYGLTVDRFHHTEEIVVKPLGWHLKELHEYAGATIMGDGKVALILDVSGLATMAGLSPLTATSRAADLAEDAARDQLRDTHTLLLFQNAPGEHCAVPLDLVLRVERIEAKQIETAGGRRTMQYRGASLPLVCLGDAGCLSPLTNQDNLAVIVTSVAQREIGLLGTMPIDVIDAKAEIDGATLRQKGISGSMIVRDKTVLLVDVFELVEAVHPEWIPKREERRHESSIAPVILLAEDSDFFRNQVRRFMESEGYTVIAAEDGQLAWELLQQNADKIQLLVTDIEMPRMSGLELAKMARSDKRFADLPIICVTSLADSEDVARGKAAGITDYQVKLDREQLLQSIRTLLKAQ